MQAVILAAGEGSRLFPFTAAIPKPLMPIAGKPLLVRIVKKLEEEDFSPITVVCLTEFADQFQYHLPNVHLTWHDGPLGTAGEIHFLREVLEEEFLVYYGDIWTDASMKAMANWWNAEDLALAALAYAPKLQVDKGVPVLDVTGPVDNTWPVARFTDIKEVREKPEINVPNLAGIGIFKRDILRYARPGEDLNRDSLAQALLRGERVLAYELPDGYLDIGSFYAFKQAQKHFRGR